VNAGWLYKVAHNLAMDRFRKSKREDAAVEQLLRLPIEGFDSPERGVAMRDAFSRMTCEDRTVLYLFAGGRTERARDCRAGRHQPRRGADACAARSRAFSNASMEVHLDRARALPGHAGDARRIVDGGARVAGVRIWRSAPPVGNLAVNTGGRMLFCAL